MLILPIIFGGVLTGDTAYIFLDTNFQTCNKKKFWGKKKWFYLHTTAIIHILAMQWKCSTIIASFVDRFVVVVVQNFGHPYLRTSYPKFISVGT